MSESLKSEQALDIFLGQPRCLEAGGQVGPVAERLGFGLAAAAQLGYRAAGAQVDSMTVVEREIAANEAWAVCQRQHAQ